MRYAERYADNRPASPVLAPKECALIDSPFAAAPPILRCPHCDGQLQLHDRALVCPHGHSFDLARAGYVNLLRGKQTGDSKEMLRARREFLAAGHYQPLSDLVNRLVHDHLIHVWRGDYPDHETPAGTLTETISSDDLPPRTPASGYPAAGTQGEWVGPGSLDRETPECTPGSLMSGQARTSVRTPDPPWDDVPPASARGFPETRQSGLKATASRANEPPRPEGRGFVAIEPRSSQYILLDVGSGEGYYLGRLQRALLDDPLHAGCRIHAFGLDASKEAARLAAARHREAALLVADLKGRLPFADRSLDVLLDIFAPRNPGEFARVLRPDGLLLVVIPAPEHLRELREALDLLAMEEQKEQHVVKSLSGHFAQSGMQRLAYAMQLAGDDLVRLVEMTPNARHDSAARRRRLDDLRGSVLPVTASFVALTFQPRYTLEGR